MKTREIKFRAWDNGVMQKIIRIPFYVDCDGNTYKDNDPYGVDMSGKRSISPLSNCILMQYTGLLDKNGKEIYEGDLLRYPGDSKNFTAYEVFFHGGDANSSYDIGYCIARTHNQGNIAGCLIPSFKPKTTAQMEVIGNIYQNPELLNETVEREKLKDKGVCGRKESAVMPGITERLRRLTVTRCDSKDSSSRE